VLVARRDSSFVAIDREMLSRHWPVVEAPRGGSPKALLGTAAAVFRSQVVYGWFAGWHTAVAVTLAWLLRKPSVVVVGGVDLANLPDIGYGFQRGGPRRWISRWVMARATRLITNSRFSQHELAANAGIASERATVVHHGVPDPFGAVPDGPRERVAITVGIVDHRNLERKGLRAFVAAAAQLPDVRFVVVGRWDDDSIELLQRDAAPNVNFTGWLSDEALQEQLRRAAVYVQASRHEGFGMSVAEAMLGGCIPVVTAAGALPEVVGDAGIVVTSADPAVLADAVETALAKPGAYRARARARVLSCFPLEMRERGIVEVVADAMAVGSGGATPRQRHYF
jgi:glycosyltransferase involved in cell wall biosynthesis